jgi:hypothetical protein
MKRNRHILLLMAVFTLHTVCAFTQTQKVTRTIIDIESGMAVPYAEIYNLDSTFLCYASVDGVFSIEVTPGSFYKFSRIGYESITLTTEQLLLDNSIKMEMLPYELNTIIVTPNLALSDINKAIESTRKRIPSTPFFQRCYKKEEIVVGNDTLLDAKAIIDFGISKVFSAGKGARASMILKGLYLEYNNSGPEDIMPTANTTPLNRINIGFLKKLEENIVFNRINSENDSITIITFHPKKYDHSKGRVTSSGRFIIDKKTWCILRIDVVLDSNTIEYINNLPKTANNKKLFRESSVSVFYSENCLPSKTEQKIVYYLRDRPDELYSWTFLHVYEDISKAEYEQKPSVSYDPEKFILQQKPVTMPDFDTHFNQGFQ